MTIYEKCNGGKWCDVIEEVENFEAVRVAMKMNAEGKRGRGRPE